MIVRRLLSSTIFLLGLFIMPYSSGAEGQEGVQQLIDQASAGDTIHIPSGSYTEPITIDKELTIIGNDDVQFNMVDDKAAITLTANNITLKQLSIDYQSNEEKGAALLIKSDYNKIEQLHIDTNGRGILLDEANYNTLNHITIKGNEQVPIQLRQRGIDLWKSNENKIHDITISHVEDGFYLESSTKNRLHNNIATHSRYGYHLMFTRDTQLYENESYENISGMMIMGTKRTKVYENTIKYNQKNVQSLGLLLFDVRDAIVERNEMTHNRIGIFVEDATENEITNNNVANNFIGLQFKRAEANFIHHNNFSANAVQGQAEESTGNKTNNNYWSDHQGLDLTGNHVSDLSYKVDPIYLHITNEYPAFRLLFQAPGMIFLENMMQTPVEEQFVDQAPLMKPPLALAQGAAENNRVTLLISTILLMSSLLIIYLGVKQS